MFFPLADVIFLVARTSTCRFLRKRHPKSLRQPRTPADFPHGSNAVCVCVRNLAAKPSLEGPYALGRKAASMQGYVIAEVCRATVWPYPASVWSYPASS